MLGLTADLWLWTSTGVTSISVLTLLLTIEKPWCNQQGFSGDIRWEHDEVKWDKVGKVLILSAYIYIYSQFKPFISPKWLSTLYCRTRQSYRSDKGSFMASRKTWLLKPFHYYFYTFWLDPTWWHSFPLAVQSYQVKSKGVKKLAKWLEEPGFPASSRLECIYLFIIKSGLK